MSHKKFGPDRFSRFDVYWIQTNKQTPRQTDKPNLYMFYDVHKENMFTINLEDGREAPSKARKKGAKRLEFLVFNISLYFPPFTGSSPQLHFCDKGR